MQKNFIEQLESRGKDNINANKQKITNLIGEVDAYMLQNATHRRKYLWIY
jgi:hypothetical protein